MRGSQRGSASTRRTIGTYGAITLEEARRIAGEWRSLIDKGIDPAVVEEEAREKEARERALRIKHSFATVAEAFITDKLAQERSGKIAERDFRANFVAIWRERPIIEITKFDVLEIINAKKRSGAPQMARALLVLIRRFFNWCVDQHVYGLDRSPCDRLKPNSIIGAVPKRNRRLSDDELFAFWRATGRMKYPTGPVYRMLLLTGLRLNECGAAIVAGGSRRHHRHPAGAHEGQGRQGGRTSGADHGGDTGGHRIAAAHRGGKYLFSLSAGKRPLAMTGPIKADLDRRMLRTLKALARRRGEDHHAVTLPQWVNHDLRRTVRSGLSALRVPHNVAEAVLAHRQGGIAGTYDLHEYQDEKARGVGAWAQRIASIVNPEPSARQGRQAAEAAAMIDASSSSPTPTSSGTRSRASCAMGLAVDADQIERRSSSRGDLAGSASPGCSRCGSCIETAASLVSLPQCRQPPKSAPQ